MDRDSRAEEADEEETERQEPDVRRRLGWDKWLAEQKELQAELTPLQVYLPVGEVADLIERLNAAFQWQHWPTRREDGPWPLAIDKDKESLTGASFSITVRGERFGRLSIEQSSAEACDLHFDWQRGPDTWDIARLLHRLLQKLEKKFDRDTLIEHLRDQKDYYADDAEKGREEARRAREWAETERTSRELWQIVAEQPSPEALMATATEEWLKMQKSRPTEEHPNVFHRGVGGFWIRFQGREPIELPYSKGLDCIHRLLDAYNKYGAVPFLIWGLEKEHPRPEITIEHVAVEKGIVVPGFDEEPIDDGGPQEAKMVGEEKMDGHAVAATLTRIADIDREIGERKREIGKKAQWAPIPDKAAEVDIKAENRAIRELKAEKKQIQARLEKDTAIFGRSRKFTTDEQRAAGAIRKNISNARGQITKKDPVLGYHFKCIYVDDMVYISYRPEKRMYWKTD
ncbi:hypothetical protein ACFLUM_03780 [Chloroflexota bacterium]